MENKESLDKMNMGKLWALARSRGIEFKGKKKTQLVKELIEADKINPQPSVQEEKPIKSEDQSKVKPNKRADKFTFVEATLADGTKVKIPAKDVTPIERKKGDTIIIKSVDGRELEASVGREHWIGKEIEVPAEMEEEVKRLLKEGGFYFV